MARALLGVVCAKFVDDFATVEPAYSQRVSQWALGALMAAIGVPFADKKHIPGASCFTFLGVESDFGQGPCPKGGNMAVGDRDAESTAVHPAHMT